MAERLAQTELPIAAPPAVEAIAAPEVAKGAELRAAPRFALLVRSAKLIAGGRELVCVLRDASATGVKVRLFHELPHGAELALELANGDRHRVELMWQTGDHAGLRFLREIDVRWVMDDGNAAFPKRPLRVHLDREVTLNSVIGPRSAMLHNLSQSGAGVECHHRLMLRQPVRLTIPGPSKAQGAVIDATVCWRHEPHYGLVFQSCFTLETLAQLVARLQSI